MIDSAKSRARSPVPQGPERVIALVDDANAYARLADALRGYAILERVRDHVQLAEQVVGASPSAVVLGIGSQPVQRIGTILGDLRRMAPQTKLVLLFPMTLGGVDALFHLPASPADDFIAPTLQDPATVRQRVLDRLGRRVAVRRLRQLLAGTVDEELQPVFDWCLGQLEAEPPAPLTVGALAQDLGRSPRETERSCRQGRSVTPRDIIAWVQALAAMQRLELPSRSLDTVAEYVGLSSARALGRLVRRKTGHTPGYIRRHGGVELLIGILRTELSRQPTR